VKRQSIAGRRSGGRVGEVIRVQVIPRPHEDVVSVLPKATAAGALAERPSTKSTWQNNHESEMG